MSKRFDELFRDIVTILRRDWAGAPLYGERFDPRYYNTAIGQAWHDEKLDELLFLRYVSQMLAATGDRHLRLTMRPTEHYTPWGPGFFTRRHEDALYVTAVTAETRLSVGDRIVRINGGTPEQHRAAIQKNFFYADEPEREDWNGFLKMADFIEVERADGSTEQLPLGRYPLPGGDDLPAPTLREVPGGRVLDLRNVAGSDEALAALLPRVYRTEAPLSALSGGDVYVNYSRLNCLVKAAGLAGVDGAEEYVAELREKLGRGFLLEPDGNDGTPDPVAAPERLIVLIDTWTRDGAEALALAAKRAGAVLVGRPTMGTLDLCGDVSYELDERYVLTWPTAIRREAYEGHPLGPVTPDVYLPWTPAECGRDTGMDTAASYLQTK